MTTYTTSHLAEKAFFLLSLSLSHPSILIFFFSRLSRISIQMYPFAWQIIWINYIFSAKRISNAKSYFHIWAQFEFVETNVLQAKRKYKRTCPYPFARTIKDGFALCRWLWVFGRMKGSAGEGGMGGVDVDCSRVGVEIWYAYRTIFHSANELLRNCWDKSSYFQLFEYYNIYEYE